MSYRQLTRKNPVTEKDCAVPPRFAYRHRTLHQLILKPKKLRTMKSTFSVIYYLKRQVVKKDGTVPVMGRITVDGSQTQFSCKLTVDPKLWDTKGGRVTGRSTAALETNRMLDKMRVRINRHYQEIMERDNFVTAEKVKNCARTSTAAPIPCGCTSARYGRWCSSPSTTSG